VYFLGGMAVDRALAPGLATVVAARDSIFLPFKSSANQEG